MSVLKFHTVTQLTGIKNLNYELAFVQGAGHLRTLADAVAQRGIDDFQRFWLWVNGVEKAPEWFEKEMQAYFLNTKALDEGPFGGLKAHLELYSRLVIEGRNVIIVSHSGGNFFANAAMRLFPDFVSDALQPSVKDRHKRNPLYPPPERLIANVQIATPVQETVGGSPWVNFDDDSVLNTLRAVVGVLPGNIRASGQSSKDPYGHHLDSYLRVPESAQRIVGLIREADQRLQYPIPFFEPAVSFQYEHLQSGKPMPDLQIRFWQGEENITSIDEKRAASGGLNWIWAADCDRLTQEGTVTIRAESFQDDRPPRPFSVRALQDAKEITFSALPGTARWNLGEIQVTRGKGKEPLDVTVRTVGAAERRP